MARSLHEDDDLDPDEEELDDLDPEEDELDDDGDAAAEVGGAAAAGGVAGAAALAAAAPMGVPARQQKSPGGAATPAQTGGKPRAARPAPGSKVGKPQAGAGKPQAGPGKPQGMKKPPGKGGPEGEGKGQGDDAKALATAQQELGAAQKAADVLEAPHVTATKKLVDSAKAAATRMSPLAAAVKQSSGEHKNAAKDHGEHEKQQGELDKALSEGGLGMIMKIVDDLKPWIDKIMNWLNRLKDALVKAFEKALKPVINFFEKVWSQTVVPAFKKTVQVVTGAFNSVGDIIGNVFKALKRACAIVLKAVGEVLKKLDFTIPSWVPVVGGKNLGLAKIGDTLVEWSTKMRDGGLVRGPGGPREDAVPVLMSNGEFVVNAAATAKHRGVLEAINNESRATTGSGYAATARSLPVTAGAQARALARADRPQLAIAGPIAPSGDRLDRSLAVNISAPTAGHAHTHDTALAARKALTYAAVRR
ncbi:hypothetical protein ACFWUP_09310 [Nocardia sp. NPDC058658]|uniref:hypothetical protein n=1 Tax=Nocardia sp. NPDC058658 TaxID=3346580 RepID=UPI0036542398